ncbi:MAG: TetR/AcrR family transcriptional regulator [Candidatus Nanopelagicaceae bacterium]|nr:TetR/AcrR family transcriptional regulator [Candidatus Nanopelagicaceae bacterium]
MSITQCIGRPRDKSRDVAIEKAAVELLQEVGYEQLTIESVATRAQVSKATIYRRWKNKAELITDSVHHYTFYKAPAIDTGSLRGDLIEVISEKVKVMKSGDGQLIAGLLAAARTDSDLAGILTHSLAEYASDAHPVILERALQRGEITTTSKPETILEITPAVIAFRIFISHQGVNHKFIEHFVDDILIPVLKHGN